MTEILFYIRFWLAFIFPCLCGFIFLRGSTGKNLAALPPMLIIALSFLLGVGILPLSMLIWGWAGMDFTIFGIVLSCLALTVLLVYCSRIFKMNKILRLEDYRAAEDLPKNDIVYWGVRLFFAFYVIPMAAIVFLKTFAVPFMWFDTLATAGFQAKVFFCSRSLELHTYAPLPSYPLQIPFLLTWMSINLGAWDPILLKVFFPFNFFAGCVVYYYVIKRFLGGTAGLLGVILLLSSSYLSFSATVAYRDVFLMNYICIAFSLLFFWYYDDNKWMLFLSAVFAGLATFTKSEGLLYALIYCCSFLVLVLKKGNVRKNLPLLFYVGIPVGFVVFLYLSYKFQRGILLNEKGGLEFSLQKLAALPGVLKRFEQDFFLKPNWGFVNFCFVFSVLIHIKKFFQGTRSAFFARVVMLFIAAIFSIALFGTAAHIVHGLLSSAGLSRIFLHFFPLTVLSVLFLNFERE